MPPKPSLVPSAYLPPSTVPGGMEGGVGRTMRGTILTRSRPRRATLVTVSGATDFDYDFVIVGSGFGGSVSALRLSEKGYRVGVLEMGKRWKREDFPKTNWNLW